MVADCSMKTEIKAKAERSFVPPSAGRQDTIIHGHYHHTRTAGRRRHYGLDSAAATTRDRIDLSMRSPSLENAHRQSAPENILCATRIDAQERKGVQQ